MKYSKKLISLLLLVSLVLFGLGETAVNTQAEVIEDPAYVAGEILVQFLDGTSLDNQGLVKAAYNLETKNKNDFGLHLMTTNGNEPIEALIQRLNKNPFVAYAEPNYLLNIPDLPYDIAYTPTYDGGSTYDLWGMNAIDAPEAFQAFGDLKTGGEVLVAVIDTGVDITHPDLDANIYTGPNGERGRNVVIGGDPNDVSDHNGHGTHVAGTIAAELNGFGVFGVAPEVTILPVKFFSETGGGSTYEAIEAINYAESLGADIINASWGNYVFSKSLESAIKNYSGIFVAAAGNDATSAKHYPSAYRVDHIVSVASADQFKETGEIVLSYFSNYGTRNVDIAAPGGGLIVEINGSLYYESLIYSTVPGGAYDGYGGTSMASPHVAGVLALMWAKDGSLPRDRTTLINDLYETGVTYGSLSEVKTSKLVNAYQAIMGSSVTPTPEPSPEPTPTKDPAVTFTADVVSPIHNERNVPLVLDIVIDFSVPIDLASLDMTHFSLVSKNDVGQVSGGPVLMDSDTLMVRVTCIPKERYKITLGIGFIQSIDGLDLAAEEVSQFTTLSQ